MNFDEPIDRNDVPTMKWSRAFLSEWFGNEQAIPMSVADMDLKAPPAVIERLEKRVSHGIYGYGTKPDSFFLALENWYRTRHGWDLSRRDLTASPSILSAISILIDQHSNEGDGVIVQPPVFFEFRSAIRGTRRAIVKNPLRLVDGRYEMDFDDLEAKASDPNTKVMILCNPHNPVGRVWSNTELAGVAETCARHDVFVIADEIHGDFAFSPHRYVPYLTVSEEAARHGAVCVSAAKTFNIAGVVDAMVMIPNDRHREAFQGFARRFHINKGNVFATAAIEAAYRDGADWLDALLDHIRGNVDLVRDHVQNHDIGVAMIEPEGTFLLWLDFRGLGLDAKQLETFLARRAGLALAPGYWFGREGAGFARMTIGCPRQTVQDALDNLTAAVAASS